MVMKVHLRAVILNSGAGPDVLACGDMIDDEEREYDFAYYHDAFRGWFFPEPTDLPCDIHRSELERSLRERLNHLISLFDISVRDSRL
ncbi:MAG: hypothetical protein ACREJQ_03145 [bacterium]